MNAERMKETTLDMHHYCAQCSEDDDLADCNSDKNRQASSFMTDLVWIVFWTVLLGSLLSAPHWLWVIDHWNDSTTPVPVGTVQRIHFIGNWGIDTQIDTEDRSFVVKGMTRFKKGNRIEQHKTPDALQLCAVEDAHTVVHCEDRVRH